MIALLLLVATVFGADDKKKAKAEEAAPEYLLGDVGVRLDLPKKTWKMLRWSDWDFKAETKDSQVMLFAWASPTELVPTAAHLDAWGVHHSAKAAELGGKDAELKSKTIVDAAGTKVGRMSIEFQFGKGGKGAMEAATLAVDGQTFHVAAVTAGARKKRAKNLMDDVVARLDVKAPAKAATGQTVEAKGITTKLPDGWREPHKLELELAVKRTSRLGLKDIEDCWLAIRPQPNTDPDVMITCQGGVLLGVVDEFSFDSKEAELQPKFFGSKAVDPAEKVELADRVGFLWDPGTSDLFVAAVPYDQGIARTWVMGTAGDATLKDSLRTAMTGSSYTGAHPASIGDRITYYLSHRLTSPVVLCPLLGVGGVGIMLFLGVGVLVMRRSGRDKYADLAEED